MTTTIDLDALKAFLLDRINERGAALRNLAEKKATDSYSGLEMSLHNEMTALASSQRWSQSAPGYEYEAWQMMMASIEVKRRMVKAWPDTTGQWSGEQAEAAKTMKEHMLRLLALEFANHPQYCGEWAL